MYVSLNGINKSFGEFQASKEVSFEIKRGQLIGLLGPSGSGKTTILRMIAGLDTPDSGDIIINDVRVNDIPGSQRGVGFVFQNYALFRYMTVYDNIAFGLKVQKKDKKIIKMRVTELIKLIGLDGLEKRYPAQLSGGQRQRVAFARALAPNPQLLLLDEPFAAVDAKVRQELRIWLKEMIERIGVTSIFVTHDQDEAVEVADEIVIMNQGKIEQKGTPIEIYKNPSTAFVAQFIGQSSEINNYNLLKGFSKVHNFEQALIRPEFVEAFKSDNMKYHDLIEIAEEGVIEDILFRGSYLELKLNVKGLHLTTNRSLERRPVKKGEKLHVLIYRMYIYNQNRTYMLENEMLQNKVIVNY